MYRCYSVPVEVRSLQKQRVGIKASVNVNTVCGADLIWTSLLDNQLDGGNMAEILMMSQEWRLGCLDVIIIS